MDKEFVPFDLAVKLKYIGFDEKCFATYSGETLEIGLDVPNDDYFVIAPLWQQAFDWLLTKIYKGIRVWYDGSGAICSWKDDSIDICFNTKEEALYLLIEDYENTCKSEN
ncbi:MAG: hypothetical protein [Caudoviricetes sp.]|nr:MAG: hypothetical protein [Caudoviricetes sp.]